MPEAGRPLLVIDGDNFAHRSYHALPKSIRRTGNRGGGAVVGFANFLLRLYESERPRAVLVGWDTLGAQTYRQTLFPAYQGGRQFDNELVEQLKVLLEFVTACGFASAKEPGYEPTTSSPPRSRQKPGAKDEHLSPPATTMRSNWRRRPPPSFTRLGPERWRGSARLRSASDTASNPRRCLILSRCEAIRRTSSRGHGASVRKARPHCSGNHRK